MDDLDCIRLLERNFLSRSQRRGSINSMMRVNSLVSYSIGWLGGGVEYFAPWYRLTGRHCEILRVERPEGVGYE